MVFGGSFNAKAQYSFSYRSVAKGLVVPWEIEIGPDGTMWTSERSGVLSRIDLETGAKKVLLDLRDSVFFVPVELGMLGFTWHPDFPDSPYVYVALVYGSSLETSYRVVERYTYENDSLVRPLEILRHQPIHPIHNGCRVKIGQDRKLYVTMGDTPNMNNADQDVGLEGKVLRMNLDGSVPDDNPVPGHLLFTKGHRNVQGFVQLPSGAIFTSEHGSDIEDEVNLLSRGQNYGWPYVEGPCDQPWEFDYCDSVDVTPPVWSSGQGTIAPCGLEYYDHERYPFLRNSLLLSWLKGSALVQLQLNDQQDSVIATTEFLRRSVGRIRDIALAPDGRIYICTSNHDANVYFPFPTPDDDQILELIPVPDTAMPVAVAPDTLRVQAFPGDEVVFPIPFSNQGMGQLRVDGIWKRDTTPIDGAPWRGTITIVPGTTYDLPGVFAPSEHGEWIGHLWIPTQRTGIHDVYVHADTWVGMLAPVADTVLVTTPPNLGRSFKVRYVNIGVRPVDVKGAEITGPHREQFRVVSVPVVTLQPQESVDLTVQYLPTEPGDHEATVRVRTSAYRDTAALVLASSRTTSVASTDADDALLVYPNPSSSAVTIRLPEDVDQGSLSILDAFGTPVFETTVVGKRSFTWNGRSRSGRKLASGLYVVALTTPYGVYHSPLQRLR